MPGRAGADGPEPAVPAGGDGPGVGIAFDDDCVSRAFISSEMVGGATGFSSSGMTMLPFASRSTHLPEASS